MKWAEIHPEPGVYDFSGADAVVAFAEANSQEVRGHTLLWHSQNPQWVIDASATWTCEEARDVLEDHIRTVVGRYAGQIYEWDVANEIFQDEWDTGGVRLRTEANPFLKACAEDPVALIGDAFRWAHEADPEALLFLNDYNAEGINTKTDAYYALAQELLADGVPLYGFGAQGHLSLMYGFDELDPGQLRAVRRARPEGGRHRGRRPHAARRGRRAGRRPDRAAGGAVRRDARGVPQRPRLHELHGLGLRRRSAPGSPGVFPEGYATIMTEEFEKKPAYYALLQSLQDETPGKSPRTAPGRTR